MIERAKFSYSPLGKAFEKQTETIEDQGRNQLDALEALKPKELKVIKDNESDDNNFFLNIKKVLIRFSMKE